MSNTEDVKPSEIEESKDPDVTTADTDAAATNPTSSIGGTEASATDDIAAAQPPAASSRTSSGSGNGNGKRERDGDDDDEETISAAATKLLKSSDDSDNTTGGGDNGAGGLLSGRSSTSVEDLPIATNTTNNTTATVATISTTATETSTHVESESVVADPPDPSATLTESGSKETDVADMAPTSVAQNPSVVEAASVDTNFQNEATTTKAAPIISESTPAGTHTDPRVAMAASTTTNPTVTAQPTVTSMTTTSTVPTSGGVDPNVAATISNPEQLVEETGVVSAQYVGRVIGKGGEMIRDLQARSGARIDVDQNVPIGQPRVITYRGTRETVNFAKHLVQMLCTDGVSDTDLPLGNAAQEHLIIPAQSVGKVIGRGGEMIRELQSRSQAKIQIDHTGQSGIPADQKQVTITGTYEAVMKGKEMVLLLVANPLMDAQIALNMLIDDKIRGGSKWGSGPPYMNLPNHGMNMQPHMAQSPQPYPGMASQPQGYGMYGQPPMVGGAPPMQQGNPMMVGGGYAPPQQYGAPSMGGAGFQQPQTMYMGDGRESELLYVSKQFMGRIIGSKGVTINDLQRRSQCDIQINQDVPPGKDCEITVKGTRQGIDMAKAMIQEIIEVGPHHPYAGGMENYGTKNVGGGYHGGSYAPQQPQQSQQYNPYQQPQPPVYDQGAAYGQPAYAPHSNPGYAAPMMGGPAYGQPMQQPQQAVPYQQQQLQQQPTPYGAVGGGYIPVPQQQQLPMVATAVPRQQPPVPPQPVAVAAVSLWKAAASPDGQIYYYNERTGETQWEKPPGMP